MEAEEVFSKDMLERCHKWTQQDEGKIFWRWLIQQTKDARGRSEKYVGVWETEKIIKANKALATEQAHGWVSEFPDRLKEILKNKNDDEFTSIVELDYQK